MMGNDDRQIYEKALKLPDEYAGNGTGADTNRRSTTDPQKPSDWKNAHLDMKKGVERFGGSMESFIQILRSFAISTRSLLDAVMGVTEGNLADYAITVHGIKGSSRNICAETAGNMAETLEKAAKAGDFDFVRTHNTDFVETIESLIAFIHDVLDKMVFENPKTKKDKPNIGTLSTLLAACKNYDMDGVDAAMTEIENFEYESGSDRELVAWLKTNIEHMNFKQIEERLSALGNAD